MDRLDFDNTTYSWYLLLIPIMIFGLYNVYQWKKKTRLEFAESHLLERLLPNNNPNLFWIKGSLTITAILFLIIALMDPLLGDELKKIKKEGIDIVYVLDISRSMDAEDIGVSRLDKAKTLIDKSIDKLGGDRVGLVVFAGNAYSLSPLTNDYAASKLYLESASTDLISEQGTNTAVAIVQGVEILKDTQNTSKALILISDGENHEQNITKAIDYAKENQVKIFCIGIGTKKGSPIPQKIYGETSYKRDAENNIVITKLEDEVMKNIATETDGQYLEMNSVDKTLSDLHAGLSKLEKKGSKESVTKDMKHNFQWFAGLSLLLLFVNYLTNDSSLFNKKK